MLNSAQCMEVTKKLIEQGIFDTSAWINSHTDEEALALIGGMTDITQPKREDNITKSGGITLGIPDVSDKQGYIEMLAQAKKQAEAKAAEEEEVQRRLAILNEPMSSSMSPGITLGPRDIRDPDGFRKMQEEVIRQRMQEEKAQPKTPIIDQLPEAAVADITLKLISDNVFDVDEWINSHTIEECNNYLAGVIPV